MKQHQQFTNAAGVARQVYAIGAIGLGLQVFGELGIVLQANQTDCKPFAAQPLGDPCVIRRWPSPLRKNAAASVNQY